MTGFVFSPADITAHAGDSVMWTNQDNTNHTVTADATNTASGGPNSDTTLSNGLTNGQTYMFTVPAGTAVGTKWYYHCRFHGSAGNGSADGAGMSGSITVN